MSLTRYSGAATWSNKKGTSVEAETASRVVVVLKVRGVEPLLVLGQYVLFLVPVFHLLRRFPFLARQSQCRCAVCFYDISKIASSLLILETVFFWRSHEEKE